MATPTEPITTEPTGALFRALRSVNVEPNLAYEAAEENCRQAGEFATDHFESVYYNQLHGGQVTAISTA